MRLRNPGHLEQAITTVDQVKGQLALTDAGNSTQRKDAFLKWCDEWATPQMGNHFPRSEGIFAEVADSYHRLAMAPPMPERQLNGLVSREQKEWEARLLQVLSDLETLRPFLSRPGRLIVLDTSALMEGAFFAEFDWHSLDGSLAGDAVRLIVPSVVIEELDELKRRPGERQRAQARRVLTTLWELHRPAPAQAVALPGRSDITIEVLLDESWHQRMPNNDGEIIDQALSVKDLTGRPVILAACDYTQLYRAAPAGLTAILMPRAGDTELSSKALANT